MEKRSKLISGLMNEIPKRKEKKYFTDEEKHLIIQETLAGNLTKQEIWKKYTGRENEHGHVLRWMRVLGYIQANEKLNFGTNSFEMKKRRDNPILQEESFESLQLKKRIEELEQQLKDAEMKAIAFSTMIEIAEREFNIPIRKKVSTKPLKK